jgi:hypothetical protein
MALRVDTVLAERSRTQKRAKAMSPIASARPDITAETRYQSFCASRA